MAPTAAPVVAPDPPVVEVSSSNFEAVDTDLEEELPVMGGEDISVTEKPRSSKIKAAKGSSKQKRNYASEAQPKRMMSIGAMIRQDRGGNHYHYQAYLAEVRRCEADRDTVDAMEEVRKLKIEMIMKESEAAREKIELEKIIGHNVDQYTKNALKQSQAFDELMAEHKTNMDVVKEALDAERSAR